MVTSNAARSISVHAQCVRKACYKAHGQEGLPIMNVWVFGCRVPSGWNADQQDSAFETGKRDRGYRYNASRTEHLSSPRSPSRIWCPNPAHLPRWQNLVAARGCYTDWPRQYRLAYSTA